VVLDLASSYTPASSKAEIPNTPSDGEAGQDCPLSLEICRGIEPSFVNEASHAQLCIMVHGPAYISLIIETRKHVTASWKFPVKNSLNGQVKLTPCRKVPLKSHRWTKEVPPFCGIRQCPHTLLSLRPV
jgi:hypothetical protein